MRYWIAALLVCSTLLVGCSALDETLSLERQMRDIVNQTNTRTRLLYREQRQGVSQEQRREALKIIRTNNPVEIKFINGAVYFQAFEFQLWENLMDVDENLRQILLSQGAEEFLVSVKGIHGPHFDDPDPMSGDNAMTSLLALSATLEQINQLQVEFSHSPGHEFQMYSMLDLLINGLSSKKAVDQLGPSLFPPYVTKVLFYEEEAKYLLLMRYNMLAAIVADKLSDQASMSMTEQLGLLMNIIGTSKSWQAKLDRLNTSEILEALRYLSWASDAREAYAKLYGKPKLNGKIAKILSHAKVIEDLNAGDAKQSATQLLENSLKDFVHKI